MLILLTDLTAVAPQSLGVPFRYYEFNSWWYYRNVTTGRGTVLLLSDACRPDHDVLGGTLLWEPRPDVFPSGFDFFSPLNYPTMLHSRYFDPYNLYATSMGYQFISGLLCLPFVETVDDPD